jgi:enoyl-CoA hydratase
MNKLDKVTYEVLDSIGIITLNTPPANELAIPGFIPIDLFTQWTSSESLKGLIITGGGKNFSAGGNLDEIFKTCDHPESLQSLMTDGLTLLNCIQRLEIPVIAAINRVCFGGGLEIALACHMRVASENALLAFPEVNQNLMPGMGGTCRLPAFAGLAQSARIILGGDIINARDAKELGFIDFIAPKDQAFEFAHALMLKMTHDRPVKVIRSVMKSLAISSESSWEVAMQEETRLFCSLALDEAKRRKKEEA